MLARHMRTKNRLWEGDLSEIVGGGLKEPARNSSEIGRKKNIQVTILLIALVEKVLAVVGNNIGAW